MANTLERTPRLSRRGVLRAGSGLLGASLAPSVFPAPAWAQGAPAAAGAMTVTLLGTGSPSPNPFRFSAATLVQAGGLNLLFDAGRGCTIRLRQLGVRLGSVSPVLITHFHSDHIVGLPDIWMTGYIQTAYAMRSEPMVLIGPEGTKQMAEGMRAAFGTDIRIRMADENTPEAATRIDAREFRRRRVRGGRGEGHGLRGEPRPADPAGLRLPGRPRRPFRADLRRHQVRRGGGPARHGRRPAAPRGLRRVAGRARQAAEPGRHGPPHLAGRGGHGVRAGEAQARRLHAHHPAHAAGRDEHARRGADRAATRRTYSGPLVVGEDLMRFVVGDGVAVQRWDAARQAYSGWVRGRAPCD